MLLISHRGNLNGPNSVDENKPSFIDQALNSLFDVEIDLWSIGDNLYLGHDEPTYAISSDWLEARRPNLWIHCKNSESLLYMSSNRQQNANYFWHSDDDYTITSLGYVWAHPKAPQLPGSILVMPEHIPNFSLSRDIIPLLKGVCSDYVETLRAHTCNE